MFKTNFCFIKSQASFYNLELTFMKEDLIYLTLPITYFPFALFRSRKGYYPRLQLTLISASSYQDPDIFNSNNCHYTSFAPTYLATTFKRNRKKKSRLIHPSLNRTFLVSLSFGPLDFI